MLSPTIAALRILWCQPWIASVQPTHTPPDPRLINIEGNSGGNNVLLTVHALPLRGGLAPCIPASQTHVPQCDSLLEKRKKKNNNNAMLPIRAACSARGAPDGGGDVWDAAKAGFVHCWWAFPAFLPAFFFFLISQWNNIRYGWRWANKCTQRWMLCNGQELLFNL